MPAHVVALRSLPGATLCDRSAVDVVAGAQLVAEPIPLAESQHVIQDEGFICPSNSLGFANGFELTGSTMSWQISMFGSRTIEYGPWSMISSVTRPENPA